jgi:small subunit ribosomal protein S17
MEERTPNKKTRVGVVTSDRMDKSVVVRVSRYTVHPLYGKRITLSKKYLAHDENNECRIGDTVSIGEGRPISKRKSWSVLRIIERAPLLDSETSSSREE